MHLGLIDVVEWQTTVDFRTGQPMETKHPLLEVASQVCAAHPYPGDLTMEGARWVTDTALDLHARLRPPFFFLDYASLYLGSLFRPHQAEEESRNLALLFAEVQRFLDATHYVPVIVGLGDLMPLQGYVDTIDLDGLASVAGMNTRCGGIFHPSARDLVRLGSDPGVQRLLHREDFRAQLGGYDEFYRIGPDYYIVAEPGYVFRGVNVGCRPLYRLPKPEAEIPVCTPLNGGTSLTDVAQQVALILVEAVGCQTFPLPYRRLANNHEWYNYTMGPGQYLALTSGLHFVDYPYPPGYRFECFDGSGALYPFTGSFRQLPEATIGQRFHGPSAAVGNRSMMTHIAAGTDIAIECFARGLYNHGVMAVLNV
jgi:hypothetical protein